MAAFAASLRIRSRSLLTARHVAHDVAQRRAWSVVRSRAAPRRSLERASRLAGGGLHTRHHAGATRRVAHTPHRRASDSDQVERRGSENARDKIKGGASGGLKSSLCSESPRRACAIFARPPNRARPRAVARPLRGFGSLRDRFALCLGGRCAEIAAAASRKIYTS